MLYQSMKLTNGIWVLAELRVQAGNPNYTVSTVLVGLCEFMSLVSSLRLSSDLINNFYPVKNLVFNLIKCPD